MSNTTRSVRRLLREIFWQSIIIESREETRDLGSRECEDYPFFSVEGVMWMDLLCHSSHFRRCFSSSVIHKVLLKFTMRPSLSFFFLVRSCMTVSSLDVLDASPRLKEYVIKRIDPLLDRILVRSLSEKSFRQKWCVLPNRIHFKDTLRQKLYVKRIKISKRVNFIIWQKRSFQVQIEKRD